MPQSDGRHDDATLERILVLVKGARDGELTRGLLARDGFTPFLCANVDELCVELEKGAAAALLAEEALTKSAVLTIRATLDRQPVWSDVPVIVFSGVGEPRTRLLLETIHQLGNVTFLDRPVQVRSMLASVHAAVRSRRRQYETRHAIESRDDFLAMLGHELRNPLGAIRLACTISNAKTPTGERSREQEVIDSQSQHLSRIVDDLLDVARITHGKMVIRPERLNLAEALRSVYELLEPSARSHLATFRLTLDDEAIFINGDRQRLEQVFTNLLTNAIKYTPAQGSVEVAARVDGDRALVVVKDTGIGLAPEMRDRVFDVFAQAERSLDRSQGGIGLGLSLVRGIVQLHDGTVHAESDGLGKGSAFVLSFPSLAAAAAPRPQGPAPAVAQAAPRRVVVVEDNADIRELLVLLLERYGHEVTCAEDGPEGLAKILATSPDIAFVDIGLPDMDGFEIARRVRATNPRVRLVAMTGYGQVEDKALAASAGFDDHLTKPVEDSDIVRAVQQAAAR